VIAFVVWRRPLLPISKSSLITDEVRHCPLISVIIDDYSIAV